MNRLLAVIGMMSLVIGGLATVAHAQEAPAPAPMTEAHIQRIRASCVQARANLYQLHASDGLLRVNRGELFRSLTTKMMVPFNTRVALNQLDSGNLVSITSRYGEELQQFSSTYRAYEEAMSDVLELDCMKQPVAFYDGVADAREKRRIVHGHAEALRSLTREYRDAFDAFANEFTEKGAKE